MNAVMTQALGVAFLVAALLALTRRGGTVAAGIATAAISAPTLMLLAAHEGAAFARLAALGTLLSTPLCASVAALGLRCLTREAGPAHAVPRSAWLAAPVAGVMSALICAAAHDLGALGSGVVSGLPVVAALTTFGTRMHSGSGAAAHYVRAYRRGLSLRAVMTLVFAATVLPLGAVGALLAALAASGGVAWVGTIRTTASTRCLWRHQR
jgi:hypothetical protein